MSRRYLATATAGLLLAVSIAACSSSSSPSSGPTSSSSASSSVSASMAMLQARITHYMQAPSWISPGPPINPTSLSGKKIMVIPLTSVVPFCADLDADMASEAKQFGVIVTQYANQGEPSQWVAGMDQALSTHQNLVDITCGLDPSTVSPQIAQFRSVGIDVVSAHAYDPSQHPSSGLSALVYSLYTLAGELEADWTILQTHGHENVLIVSDEGDVSTPAILAGIQQQFAQYCLSCKVSYVYIPVPDFATEIEPAVAGKINSDPQLNYIIPIADVMVQYVVPAIVAAGATGRIHVASSNGTPSVVQMIETGTTVTFDVGEDYPWLSRAILDQDFRVLLHTTPGTSEYAPVRIFTKQNAIDAGSPPSFENGYGNAYTNFAVLWKG